MDRLVQCQGCSRHVKSQDPACPFCGAPVLGAPALARDPFRRMTAAAAVAAGVASLTGCSSSSPPSSTPFYGAVIIFDATTSTGHDGATDVTDARGPSEPDVSTVVFYGAPAKPDGPSDASDDASDGASDAAAADGADGA